MEPDSHGGHSGEGSPPLPTQPFSGHLGADVGSGVRRLAKTWLCDLLL